MKTIKLFKSQMTKICSVLVFCAVMAQAATSPVLFFTDLTSGPATGNSDPTFSANGGAYITLYGNFLGSSPSVTLNGASCLTIVSQPATWLWYQKMIVQVGPACTSGNFVATNANGASNGIPFSIVSGHTYYVSPTGNDSTGTGSFQAPWLTINKVKSTMADGDVTYFENGFTASANDSSGHAIYYLDSPNCASSLSAQRAAGAYPGATVTLGTPSSGNTPIAVGFNGGCNGFTFFGWTLRTSGSLGMYISYATSAGANGNIRLVGTDVSCPNGNSASACLVDGGVSAASAPFQITYYGNNIHDIGTGNNGLYHAIYHGTDYSVRDAWNEIYNVAGACRGIQIFSSTANFVHYDMHIHDNVIHDTGCDAIGMYDTDPSIKTGAYGGGAEVYNNVMYNTGVTAAAVSSAFYYSQDNGPVGGTVEVYGNTFYNCETNSCFSMANFDPVPTVHVHVHNNIMYQLKASVPYWSIPSAQVSFTSGENNLVFGAGSSISGCGACTGTVNLDPGFVSASGDNFHLSTSNSPANGAGSTGAPVPIYDHDGLVHPSPPAIGAFEFASGTTPPPPSSCDVNHDGVVNVADVQLEVNMALGISTCTNSSGTCTVVSVQRVVNAALGGTCVSP